MTNTREEVAVAEAIAEALFTTHGFASSQPMMEAAQSAIAASNSKYVPMLVEALKDIVRYDPTVNWQGARAQTALNNLPEELKQ